MTTEPECSCEYMELDLYQLTMRVQSEHCPQHGPLNSDDTGHKLLVYELIRERG